MASIQERMASVGPKLKALGEKKADLVQRCGISPAYWSRVLRGERSNISHLHHVNLTRELDALDARFNNLEGEKPDGESDNGS